MIFFEEATLRLKQQLKLVQDREVAPVLGMTPRAWAGRKKNESFPANELYALAAKRPDLQLDVDYILTGAPSTVRSALHQTAIERQQHEAITAQLLADWQACSVEDQRLLCELAARLKTAKRPKDTGPVLPAPKQTPPGSPYHYSFAQPTDPAPKLKRASPARAPRSTAGPSVGVVHGQNIQGNQTNTAPQYFGVQPATKSKSRK